MMEWLIFLREDPVATLMMVALATVLVLLILMVARSILGLITYEKRMVEYRRRCEREAFLRTLRGEDVWK